MHATHLSTHIPMRLEESAAPISSVVIDASSYSLPYDYSLCNALVKHGCNPTLICSEFLHEPWNMPAEFGLGQQFYRRTHTYARTHHRGKLWRLAKGAEHALDMAELTSRLQQNAPDIIHFEWLPLPIVDGFFLSRLRKIAPLVLTLHNTTMFHGAFASKLQTVGFRSSLAWFDAVIVHAEFSKRRAVELGWLPADRMHVIPHGVLDYYCHKFINAPEPAHSSEKNVLFFGNLKPYKGLDVLIRAVAQLVPAVRQTLRVVIAGKPMMDIEPLKTLARSLGVEDRITWQLGHVDENDVAGLFRSATVVVLPYREIDQSGVLATTLPFGKPVIASRVGGIAEVLSDGIHGYLVEPCDAGGLAVALERVLVDSALARSMGNAVRKLAEGELSWGSIAQKTIRLYSQLRRREPVAQRNMEDERL